MEERGRIEVRHMEVRHMKVVVMVSVVRGGGVVTVVDDNIPTQVSCSSDTVSDATPNTCSFKSDMVCSISASLSVRQVSKVLGETNDTEEACMIQPSQLYLWSVPSHR